MPTATCSGRLELTEVDGIRVAHMRDRRVMDEGPVRSLTKELTHLLKRMERPQLLLNFEGVEYLSSLGVAMLYLLNDQATEAGGRLALCGVHPDLAEVLALSGLDQTLAIYPDEASALASF